MDFSAKSKPLFENGESLEFSGKAIAHLAAADTDNLRRKTGRILLTADLAREFDFTDDNGLVTGDMRNVKALLSNRGYGALSAVVPAFLTIPHRLFYMLGYKF